MSDINKSSNIYSYNHNGFTLAEVLITLVIIGVIAAITVPTMIAKYQKEQTVTRLKKAYSALAQTTNRAIIDNGPMNTWTIGQVNSANDAKAFLLKYVTPYMSIMKKPETANEGHWDKNIKFLNNTDWSYDNNFVRFYLADGTSMTTLIEAPLTGYKRLMIFVDINGDKKPNKIAKDIFLLNYYISSPDLSMMGRVFPEGFNYGTREDLKAAANWGCEKNKNGTFCSGLIMRDGWRIADDYPW